MSSRVQAYLIDPNLSSSQIQASIVFKLTELQLYLANIQSLGEKGVKGEKKREIMVEKVRSKEGEVRESDEWKR